LFTNRKEQRKMTSRFLFCFLALFCFSLSFSYGAYVLEGVVINGETGDVLVDASITVKETGFATRTKPDGTFSIEFSEKGTYTLLLKHGDLRGEYTRDVAIGEKEGEAIDWVVVPSVPEGKFPQLKEEEEKREGGKTLKSMDGVGGVKVQTVCTSCNTASISMNGLGATHVKLLVDGLPFSAGEAALYDFTHIPAELIRMIEFEKGAGLSSASPEAAAGVVNVLTRKPEISSAYINMFVGDLGWFYPQVVLSGRRGRTWTDLVFSLYRSNNVDANDDGNIELADIDRREYGLRWGFEFTPDSELRISGLYQEEEDPGGRGRWFQFAGMYGTENDFKNRHEINTSWRHHSDRFGDFFLGYHHMIWHRYTWADTFPGQPMSYTYRYRKNFDTVDFNWSKVIKNVFTKAGLLYNEEDYEIYQNPLRLTPENVLFDDLRQYEAFVETSFNVGGAELTVGGRYVHWDPFGVRIVPRAALVYKPNADWLLRFTAGEGFRAPRPITEICCTSILIKQPMATLPPEISKNFSFSLTYQPKPNFKFEFNTYLTDADDFSEKAIVIEYEGRQVYVGGYIPPYLNEIYPEARFQGADLNVDWTMKEKYTLKAGIAFLDAEERTSGKRIPYYFRRTATTSFAYNGPENGISVNLSGEFFSSMPIQYLLDSSVDGVNDLREELEYTPFYMLWNAKVSKEFRSGFTAFVGIDNLFDEVQDDLADPHTDYKWGSLKGRYLYGGFTVKL
jgi:outer membrane receptor for ferrienterochelin and colicins